MKKQLTPAAFPLSQSRELEARCAAKRAEAKRTRQQRRLIMVGAAAALGFGWLALLNSVTPTPTQTAMVAAVPTEVEADASNYQRDPVHGYPVDAWKHLKGEEQKAALKEHCNSHLVNRDFAPECAAPAPQTDGYAPGLNAEQKAQCVTDDVQADMCETYLVKLAEIEYDQMQHWRRGG